MDEITYNSLRDRQQLLVASLSSIPTTPLYLSILPRPHESSVPKITPKPLVTPRGLTSVPNPGRGEPIAIKKPKDLVHQLPGNEFLKFDHKPAIMLELNGVMPLLILDKYTDDQINDLYNQFKEKLSFDPSYGNFVRWLYNKNNIQLYDPNQPVISAAGPSKDKVERAEADRWLAQRETAEHDARVWTNFLNAYENIPWYIKPHFLGNSVVYGTTAEGLQRIGYPYSSVAPLKDAAAVSAASDLVTMIPLARVAANGVAAASRAATFKPISPGFTYEPMLMASTLIAEPVVLAALVLAAKPAVLEALFKPAVLEVSTLIATSPFRSFISSPRTWGTAGLMAVGSLPTYAEYNEDTGSYNYGDLPSDVENGFEWGRWGANAALIALLARRPIGRFARRVWPKLLNINGRWIKNHLWDAAIIGTGVWNNWPSSSEPIKVGPSEYKPLPYKIIENKDTTLRKWSDEIYLD